MNALQKLVAGVDRVQQQHAWLAFPVAVFKKFGDDQAGNLAALMAYYAFASIFPLLLVLVTVLDIVLAHDPALQTRVLSSALGQFPVIGSQLHLKSMNETGPALIIGLVLTFLGARGVAGAAQNALNTVWGVPLVRRPGFPWAALQQIALILVVGIGMIVTTLLSGLAGHVSPLHGVGVQIATVLVSLILNAGVFWLGFRLATAKEIGMRQMLPSAIAAAVIWQVLQLLGTWFIQRTVHSSAVYGVFAIVLGLLAWLYLAAQLVLYAVEANVVAVRRLAPRSLAAPPLTEPDRRAYGMYATMQERRPEQQVESRIADQPPEQQAGGGLPDQPPEQQAQSGLPGHPPEQHVGSQLPEGRPGGA
jgi:membrane protein